MKQFFLILGTTLSLLACSSKNNTHSVIVGNDADEHGCKRSTVLNGRKLKEIAFNRLV